MGLFSNLFGNKKTTLKEADKINDAFIEKATPAKNDENAKMRNASKLLTSGQFTESLDLYKKMAEEYPQNKGVYESQVGANYFFLEQYEKAIEYYVSAMNNDADKSMIDDNIWEATEILYKQTGDKTKIEYYINLFPNGNYIKKAKKLL
jgi:tetratricopeptide (TPR) repeat protein